MEVRILERVAEVRKPGSYLGFLEWVGWGLASKRRILMLFGDEVWDLLQVFAPDLPPMEFVGECRAAAVCLQADGQMVVAGRRT